MSHCSVPTIALRERETLTMGEAAALLGVSVSTLYAERDRGRLATIRLAGRRLITRPQLDAYIAAAGHDRPSALATTGLSAERRDSVVAPVRHRSRPAPEAA
jgi:excisionase family DNA binding protein